MGYQNIPIRRPRISRRSMAYLGATPQAIFQAFFGKTFPLPPSQRRYPLPPLPVPPRIVNPFPAAPPKSVLPPATPPSGYCVFTSSPQTGSVTSVAACSAGPGGTPLATPAATPSVNSPVPVTQPTNQPYTDSMGNIWTYGVGGWQITGNVSSALTSAGGGSVAPAPAASAPLASSPYQSVLDWLSQETLITGFPNWGVALAAVGGIILLKNRSEGRR